MEPLNKEKGFNMVNLKITLDGKERQTPNGILKRRYRTRI
jgi:hypothetical protein